MLKKNFIRLLATTVSVVFIFPYNGFSQPHTKDGKMRVSVEWGFTQTLYRHHHYNINSSEGYRINENTGRFDPHANADALIGINYCPKEKFYMGFYSGYMGIYENSRVFPFLLRLGIFYNDFSKDGFQTFMDGGIGLCPPGHSSRSNAAVFGVGEAYRMILGGRWALDFSLSLRCAADSPPIDNPEGAGYVQKQNIRTNKAEYFALNFSVAVSF